MDSNGDDCNRVSLFLYEIPTLPSSGSILKLGCQKQMETPFLSFCYKTMVDGPRNKEGRKQDCITNLAHQPH